MDDKPKVSAKGTYVLDQDELDRLDELSLTDEVAQLEEGANLFPQPHQELGEVSSGSETDSLPVLHGYGDSQDDSIGESETAESRDDLIPTETPERCTKPVDAIERSGDKTS